MVQWVILFADTVSSMTPLVRGIIWGVCFLINLFFVVAYVGAFLKEILLYENVYCQRPKRDDVQYLLITRGGTDLEIIIRENDSLPIYEQIVREVKKAIIKKEIMPGDMMPSIRALARELEISVITTKRAYEELEKEQLIYSVAGKGFYVKARNRELLKEDQIRQIEEKMMDAVEQAKEMGVSLRELKKMLEMFYVGGR